MKDANAEEDMVEPSTGCGSSSDSAEHVMSEVHLGCPPRFSDPFISHFTFQCPCPAGTVRGKYTNLVKGEGTLTCQTPSLDSDGDLVLTRRNKPSNCEVTIQHKITSSIPSVGLQVWRAALVLADFVLHTIFTSSNFDGIVALELGAGTGLVGILLARVARTVFLTDHDDEVLDNCTTNAHLNFRMFEHRKPSVYVRKLDWKQSWPPRVEHCDTPSQQRNRYSWISSEVDEAERASLLLAADVIYSDDLTDSIFNTVEGLMSRGCEKVLYLALEKRYNFSLDDRDVVANGYSHFRGYLKDEGECRKLECRLPYFVGKLVDLSQIPQYVKEYNRGSDLEIWQIKYASVDHN